MEHESEDALLIRALAAYKGVVADPATYGPLAEELVDRARQCGDHEALVVAFRAAAWAERAHLDNERARTLLDESVRLASRHGLEGRLVESLVTRAAVNLELGRVTAAQRDLDRAGHLVGPDAPPELQHQRAVLDQNLGRLSEAAAIYRAMLADPRTPLDVQAKMANNLAIIEAQRGELPAALRSLVRAAAAAEGAGPALAAVVAQTTASVYVQAGRLHEGISRFDDAARRYAAAGLSLGEPFIEQADALADLRLLPEARELAGRALQQFSERGIALMEAEARIRQARLLLLSAEPSAAAHQAAMAAAQLRAQRRFSYAAQATVIEAEARAAAGDGSLAVLRATSRAAALLERQGMTFDAVEAHLAAGRMALCLDREASARRGFERAQALAGRAPVLTRLKGHVAGAMAARLRGDDAMVVRRCRAGLRDLDAYRAALGSLELRALAASHGAELGRLGLGAALGRGSPARVLEWMERTRAAALVIVDHPSTDGVDDDLAALRAVTDSLFQHRRDGVAPPEELVSRQLTLETRIRRATWARGPAHDGSEAGGSASAVRAALAGRVLVAFGSHAGTPFAVVQHERAIRLVRLPAAAATVTAEAASLLFALRRLRGPSARAGPDGRGRPPRPRPSARRAAGAPRPAPGLRTRGRPSLRLAPHPVGGAPRRCGVGGTVGRAVDHDHDAPPAVPRLGVTRRRARAAGRHRRGRRHPPALRRAGRARPAGEHRGRGGRRAPRRHAGPPGLPRAVEGRQPPVLGFDAQRRRIERAGARTARASPRTGCCWPLATPPRTPRTRARRCSASSARSSPVARPGSWPAW